MSLDGWNTLLVLGGIRSGKSEFAESLVADAPTVRYLATAADQGDDPEWAARLAAHRARRPATWSTEETAVDPRRLADVISTARPEDTLLVDDLGGWVTVLLDPAHQPADDTATIDELATAVRSCAARLVLVSPEVGLSLVPTTPLGRAFTDALGAVNRAVADVCDTVVLVVAGQPCRLKPAASRPPSADSPPAGAVPPAPSATVPAQAGPAGEPRVTSSGAPLPGSPPVTDPQVPTEPAAESTGTGWTAPTMALPVAATGLVIQPGMELPMPDEYTGPQAVDRLSGLDVPGNGLGALEQVLSFAAATQGTPTPTPWRSVRVLLVHGDHAGGVAAGTVAGESARRAGQASAGQGVLARLAAESGASLQVVDAPAAAPIEHGPALRPEQVQSALRYGWRLAEEAADAGVELLVLAACGAGSEAAAAAVLAATAGAEPPAVLARVVTADGEIDDVAWMARCAAVRDALHRTRRSPRSAIDVLAELGGGDFAVATGILLGATARRLPVLLDGPVGVAAGLISRDLAGQARHWCLLADDGGHPAVRLAADVLGLDPLIRLRLDLGEGANALAVLPLLRSALALAAALPSRPDPSTTTPAGEPAETSAARAG
ncbi:bifunctional adenosylcobinamide kinase/adenosylcobinamide-phosphate guanylyltransferase [Micromonospora sp. HNM0581]|uniref:bifunctional adenosylcobinamide kinase/adenosylcobinamide-phosphate guanylyltransferase n=1 Tax=Micromonospora sp. HNM0581 TaxID=2716341 RepID=UPI00146A3D21|nr:bifunctional adenosylcobinamide kinase/adenosylcobinamide-phosphate guanylyltransferase [Micromonospora sp. HNM0581]NLU77404.1 bifunctional adenosylcobinamide kinase/adenosylcobinamide-phosphate guanylyltransferase [Micromonospora sp. HNM0581]